MKKYNTPWAVAAIFAALLFISMIYTVKFANLAEKQRTEISHLNYEVNAQKKALELSDDIMDNNELWDKDGSDLMVDYLNLRSKLDRDFVSGFYHNALLDSLSFTYNK